ncbi:MAG: amidohydrolase family protein [Spirochaetales bacterium]|nr:amidohydrolase family protein [Spirochaetales bacterium]
MSRRIVNTHCHHMKDEFFADPDLTFLLKSSYVAWCGEEPGDTAESRQAYLDKVRFKSYFKWLEKSLMSLYGMNEPVSVSNWEEYSRRIREAYRADPDRHLTLLKKDCGYSEVILDTYWNPGSDNGHGELFRPAFRIDPFLFGWDSGQKNHDGLSFGDLYDFRTDDPDELLEFARQTILEKKKKGAVALKSAAAYERTLDYRVVDKKDALRAMKAGKGARPEEIRAFQDYIFSGICRLAAETGTPFQIHTGLGQLVKTAPMELHSMISRHPETKFVLFHGGFPWIQDMMALLHSYRNVYPDLCWLPLLSPKAAETALHQYIEIGLSDRVCWGCDTWSGEESYGAVMAFEAVLNKVLKEKKEEGYLSEGDFSFLKDGFRYRNGAKLYDFSE